MAQWKRWNMSRKVLFLTAVLAVIALTAWATNRQSDTAFAVDAATAVGSPTKAEALDAPMPPPVQVTIQKTSAFSDVGNVLVMVTLSSLQLSRKASDGTRDFITIGFQDQETILRDDGLGGDERAGDGVFTGIGNADDADLQARADSDAKLIANRGNKQSPLFIGRTNVGNSTPVAFDFAGFQAGRPVAFGPPVAFVGTETATTTTTTSSGFVKAVVLGTNPFQERVLMIRDLAVVTDPARTWDPCTGAGNPNGVWTFNHLMTQMANQPASGIDPSIFVEQWLAHWQAAQTINTHLVPAKLQVNNVILTPWPKRPDGHIDLAQSSFRLLAIVSRVDLRRTTSGGGGYGGGATGNFLDAGEARFIFGLVDKRFGCTTSPYAVIFEYRVPKCECEMVKGWAKSWVNLAALVPGTAAYNNTLQVLTEQFVRSNSNPTQPNGSALGQLRTNEISLGGPWELREFQLTQFPFSLLNETTTADTAIDAFNNTALFDNWILTAVAPGLTAPNFQDPIPGVPLLFTATNFLGSNPRTPNTNFFWRVTNPLVPNLTPLGGNNTTNWGRHRASLASCNGCHARESRPAATLTPFVHVDPSTPFGAPANLSEFLTGVNNLPDPQEAGGLPLRSFDDLARREVDIQQVAAMTCVGFHPVDVAAVQASLRASGKLPPNLFTNMSTMPVHHLIPVGVSDFKRNVITEVH
jgi:hypothetical protein